MMYFTMYTCYDCEKLLLVIDLCSYMPQAQTLMRASILLMHFISAAVSPFSVLLFLLDYYIVHVELAEFGDLIHLRP